MFTTRFRHCSLITARSSPLLQTATLFLELLDYGSERGISDDAYMGIADRFTAWMCWLCEPATFTPEYIGPRTRHAERKRLWREGKKEKARSHE